MKICLVCSAGGHFLELLSLKPIWEKYDRFWVTFSMPDTRFMLRGEKVYRACAPTNRNFKNLALNSLLAVKVLSREKPQVIISTGAGVAIPFLYFGRLAGAETIYIESLTRITDLSLTGRLVYPIVHRFFVQWPELAGRYRRARYRGRVG